MIRKVCLEFFDKKLENNLLNSRDQYNEILMREYCTQFETAIRDDNYAQITVNNDVEYRKIVNNFPVHKRSLEQVIKIQNAMFSMSSM